MNKNILIVDDEDDIRKLIGGILNDEGYETRAAESAQHAYESIKSQVPDLIILDIWLQGSDHDGLVILDNIKKDHPNIPVIMISGHGTIETAVKAIKQGAYDFIEKPFKSDRLLLMIRRALEAAELKRENETLRQKAIIPHSKIIGTSQAINGLQQILQRVAKTNSRVLITGEPGTGKEIAARVIHQSSDRANKPFLTLSCATLRPERLEQELFGTTQYAGEKAKTGLLEHANQGTLLLDEVGDMPLETQAKMLRVLQEQKFQKIGSDSFMSTDIRIIATTNKNLEKEVKAKKFREDLFYRLNVVPLHMPALKEHAQDIPDLISYFIAQIHRENGLPIKTFDDEALTLMKSYDWPGNVRQLRNVVEWTLIMKTADTERIITATDLPPELIKHTQINIEQDKNIQEHTQSSYLNLSLKEARDIFELNYISAQIKRFGGNISKTAKFVGMERSALHRKIKSLKKQRSAKLPTQKKASPTTEAQNENKQTA